ncbi:SDR family NAD(P)-dependent oxidoreductase [Candidatus Bathyarchaeota archaeon]|nr:SDR family NAD(P)-dependent oxidoreductase [Candidatus Bathyarchaeota archaeon]
MLITGGAQGVLPSDQHPPCRLRLLTLDNNKGIGRATADLLASKGAKIVIADVSEVKASEAVRELRADGYEAASFVGDALEDGFAEKAVKGALDAFGKVNCLVNNAGFCYDAPIHKMDDEKWDIIMKIHNYVPFRMVRALSAHWMDPANRDMPKTVVNLSSTSGLHGQMGQINYATAKMGVVGLTKSVAAEWARYVFHRQYIISLAFLTLL